MTATDQPHPVKWGYKRLNVDANLPGLLDAAGEDGWEAVCSYVDLGWNKGRDRTIVLLKRMAQDD